MSDDDKIYVDATAARAGDGSKERPFKTVSEALFGSAPYVEGRRNRRKAQRAPRAAVQKAIRIQDVLDRASAKRVARASAVAARARKISMRRATK